MKLNKVFVVAGPSYGHRSRINWSETGCACATKRDLAYVSAGSSLHSNTGSHDAIRSVFVEVDAKLSAWVFFFFFFFCGSCQAGIVSRHGF